jgi:hypothetical protein
MPVTRAANIQANPVQPQGEVQAKRRQPFDLGPDDAAVRDDGVEARHDDQPGEGNHAGQPRRSIARVGGKERRGDAADEWKPDDGEQKYTVPHNPWRNLSS